MKEEFQEDFLKESTWGEFGSKEEVCALTSLLDYLKKTSEFAEQFPQLLNDVIVDNKNLVLQRMIPIPSKLYEQILLAVVEGAQQQYQSIWEQPCSVTLHKIEQYLLRRKTGSLLILETQMFSEVQSSKNCTLDKMSKAAAGLRKLRNQIYSGIKYSQNVQAILEKLYTQTENFIDRFGSELSSDGAETFRRRVRITRNAVQASLNKRLSDDQSLHDEMSDPGLDMEELVDSSLSPEPDIEDLPYRSLSLAKADDADSDAVDKSCTGQITSKHQEQHHLVEEFVITLPAVPFDSGSKPPEIENILGHDIDEQIQQRLTRLKFLTQAWSQNSPTLNSTTISEVEDEVLTTSETDNEIVPVESTEEDREEFNAWYYAQIENPAKQQFDSSSKYQSCSDDSSTLSATNDLSNPKNINTTYMNSTNDQQMIAWSSTSQTRDLTMVSPTSDLLKSEISKHQELLEVMSSLYYMQVNVVIIIIFTASIILDNLSMELLKCTYDLDPSIKPSDPAVLCVQPGADTQLPDLGQKCVQGVQDHSLQEQQEQGVQGVHGQCVQGGQGASGSYIGNGYVPPWKRIGISYTKLHSAQML